MGLQSMTCGPQLAPRAPHPPLYDPVARPCGHVRKDQPCMLGLAGLSQGLLLYLLHCFIVGGGGNGQPEAELAFVGSGLEGCTKRWLAHPISLSFLMSTAHAVAPAEILMPVHAAVAPCMEPLRSLAKLSSRGTWIFSIPPTPGLQGPSKGA